MRYTRRELREAKKKRIRKIIINIFFLIILSYAIINIMIWLYQTKKDNAQLDNLRKSVVISKSDTSTAEIIDFEKLHEINKDIKGWIKIEKLNINYPILQSTDNTYYLKRDFTGTENMSGSIFMDYRNQGFEEKNVVIYGHNMKNNTMFGNLDKIIKNEIDGEIEITIITAEKEYRYKVFSTYEVEPQDFDMTENIEALNAKSKINFNQQNSSNDKILTLCTCTNTSVKRTIVHAVLKTE